MSLDLRKELAAVLNRHSRENVSNTPDFILADYLVGCLEAWDKTHNKLRVWQAQHFDESVDMQVAEPVIEWRPLLEGEFVEEGDEEYVGEVWPYRKEWHPVTSWGYYYGSKLHLPHRRRVKATASPKLVHMDLQNGDVIWEDDEYLSLSSGDWEKTSCYGQSYYYGAQYASGCHRPHRRLFAAGYRWLRAGDVVISGDEILENGKWSPIDETGAYDPVVMKPVRRKI